MLTEARLQEIKGIADDVRLKCMGSLPPIDLNYICSSNNIVVYYNYDMRLTERNMGGKISGALLRDGEGADGFAPSGVIFVNKNDLSVRKRFTVAHELGHYFLHEGKAMVSFRGGRGDDETEANRFAAELLMPEDLVRKDHRGRPAVIPRSMAEVFQVSTSAMEIRLEQLGLHYSKYLV